MVSTTLIPLLTGQIFCDFHAQVTYELIPACAHITAATIVVWYLRENVLIVQDKSIEICWDISEGSTVILVVDMLKYFCYNTLLFIVYYASRQHKLKH